MHRSRRLWVVAAAILLTSTGGAAVAGPLGSGTPSAIGASATPTGLARLLAASAGEAGPVTGIATFDAVPTAATTVALQNLGLEVQPMQRVPLALVRGAVSAMQAAVTTGTANDVYPDERIQLLDTASSDAMGAAGPRSQGLTGKGVTVAVVDSGCDASHPDLADHVTHNVKLISGEYANIRPEPSNTIVVPIEEGPYQNTDLGSGHGTHVAGIIAADGTTGPEHLGVAPDAELVCLAMGEGLFTTAVVTAYDYLLRQPDMWGVDVINNSWGNLYAQFDPANPVAVITREAVLNGATVVFAAGNSGRGDGEATLNPFSQSPWVISVAASTLDHQRGDFSSNGFRFDNSEPFLGTGGRTTYVGERVGLVHPDVTAPGVAISSSCDTAGVIAIGPCPPGENIEAQGTSMASPHVAGAAAVLRQVNPTLTPAQVQQLLQVTATPVFATGPDDLPTAEQLPFWQVGYGHVDLAAAADMAGRASRVRQLGSLQAGRDQQVLRATGFRVTRSDFLTYPAPRITLGTDTNSLTVPVAASTTHVKVTLAFPSEAALGNDFGLTEYTATVTDAAGQVVGTSERVGIGTVSVLVDIAAAHGVPGDWTVDIVGDRAVSDPDTLDSDSLLNDTVTLQVAQLVAR